MHWLACLAMFIRFSPPHALPVFYFISCLFFLVLSHPEWLWWDTVITFTCSSMMAKYIIFFDWPLVLLYLKGYVQFICLLLIDLFGFKRWLFSPLHITGINPLSNEWYVKIFSNSVTCLFNPLAISFTYRNLLISYANAKSCFSSLNNWNFSQVNSSILILENLFLCFPWIGSNLQVSLWGIWFILSWFF